MAFFVLVACLLYVVLYAVTEVNVYRTSLRNRFFVVNTAPRNLYDVTILGASHALPLGFEDMNSRLEDATGAHIVNLSLASGGIVPNRVLLDYFFQHHTTRTVVYFLDSFVFFSPKWNEQRLEDPRLYARAPLDAGLAQLLLSEPTSLGAGLLYLSGFPKVNNSDRFAADISDDEANRFQMTYRPVDQIDRLRMRNLYPTPYDETVFTRYMSAFELLVDDLSRRGIQLVVIKPPITSRWMAMLPDEPGFHARLQRVLAPRGIELHDLARSVADDALFFDADHLNRQGVLYFFSQTLEPLMRAIATPPNVA